MIINCGTLDTVVRYLSSFGGPESLVTFTPWGQSGVSVVIEGDHGHARYDTKCVEPLDARFSISLGNLSTVAGLASEDSEHIEITRGSRIKFVPGAQNREWWVDYAPGYAEMPVVKKQASFSWGGDFGSILESVSHGCREHHANGSLDCVHVEVNSSHRSMASTDGCLIIAHDERWRLQEEDDIIDIEDSNTELLVPKSTVNGVLATCESAMPVVVHIGQTNVSYRCGARVSTFPRKRGSFPKWRNAVRDGIKGRVLGFLGFYCDSVEAPVRASRMFGDICDVKTHYNGVLLQSGGDQGSCSVVMDAEWGGNIESLSINSSYLQRISSAWCEPDFKVSYRGEDRPLEIGSIFHKSPMTALLMPAVKVPEEEESQSGQGS